jgi:protein-disulfide isomerase
MRRAVLLVAVLSLAACSGVPAQQRSDGSDPAARVGDRVITAADVERRWRELDPAGQAETTQRYYEGRRGAVEAIVAEMLIAEAASARGVTPGAYEEEEIAARLEPVTEADVSAFYQENIGQMQGRSIEVMGGAIRQYLQEQRAQVARLALVSDLRRTGPDVRILFDVPRFEVAIEETDPSLGPESAPVTLVEFSDLQCPFCRSVAPTLERLREAYGDRIRIVWKDFPLTQIHPQAFQAGEAAHCAGEQGRFWEYHDRLFANQDRLLPDDLRAHAAGIGLDAAAFDACLAASTYAGRVQAGVTQGTSLGVSSTPTVYVNGRLISGAQPYELFAAVIDEELSIAR